MHKIKKGIKKKIKGKKGKEDDEIFTAEELEEYKRRKEEEAKKSAEQEAPTEVNEEPCASIPVVASEVETYHPETYVDENTEKQPQEADNSSKDDWKNFLSSTDTVLKKTTENLEQIKETSYYQAKKHEEEKPIVDVLNNSATPVSVSPAPASTSTRWVDLEKGGIDDKPEEQEPEPEPEPEPVREPTPEPIELKPIEDLPDLDVEDFVDAFDTTFVDNVESGDVKLYYIPDSPTYDDPDEPDPFDTSVVDKVLEIKKPKLETKEVVPGKKKKNLVSLGCAVDVLTGKLEGAEKLAGAASKDKRRIVQKEVNLFGDDTTSEVTTDSNLEENNTESQENKVDDILFGGELEGEVLDTTSVTLTASPKHVSENKEKVSDDKSDTDAQEVDLSEFLDTSPVGEDSAKNKKEKKSQNSDLNDIVAEFDVIDKSEIVDEKLIADQEQEKAVDDEFDAEFTELAEESVIKAKEAEYDPFDTTAAAEVLGPEPEIKEEDPFDVEFANEVLGTNEENTPSRPPPPRPPQPEKKEQTDLLCNDNEEPDPFDTSVASEVVPINLIEKVDESDNLSEVLQPAQGETIKKSESFDPFDTSAAAAFGKTELKYLESELLSDNTTANLPKSDSDFDFNPRAGEEEKAKPPPPPRPVSPACFLTNENEIPSDPVLTPQTAVKQEEEFDPFDTSIADKVQIQSLEEVLLDKSANTNSSAQNLNVKKPPPRPASPNSLLTEAISDVNPALQPINKDENLTNVNEIDPFDTSIADQFGKTELKVLESELLAAQEDITEASGKPPTNTLELKLKPPRPASPQCLLAATPIDENPTLQPVSKDSADNNNTEDDFDPFDTSIAEQFGKTELKVLETELLAASNKSNLEDNDFNPRSESPAPKRPSRPPSPAVAKCLLTAESPKDFTSAETLTPQAPKDSNSAEEFDPFDTSIAESYGKTELRYLENELLSDIKTADNSTVTKPVGNNSIIQNQISQKEVDPFDTSIADIHTNDNQNKDLHINLNENKKVDSLAPVSADHLFDSSPSAENLPTLQPTSNLNADQRDEVDPFDTSIAEQFGKTELKVLENELFADSGSKQNLSDDEFNPREHESPKRPPPPASEPKKQISILDSIDDQDIPDQPILAAQPITENKDLEEVEEYDPFDTSIASNVGPGKTELKLLESELLPVQQTKELDPFDTSHI